MGSIVYTNAISYLGLSTFLEGFSFKEIPPKVHVSYNHTILDRLKILAFKNVPPPSHSLLYFQPESTLWMQLMVGLVLITENRTCMLILLKTGFVC